MLFSFVFCMGSTSAGAQRIDQRTPPLRLIGPLCSITNRMMSVGAMGFSHQTRLTSFLKWDHSFFLCLSFPLFPSPLFQSFPMLHGLEDCQTPLPCPSYQPPKRQRHLKAPRIQASFSLDPKSGPPSFAVFHKARIKLSWTVGPLQTPLYSRTHRKKICRLAGTSPIRSLKRKPAIRVP